MITPENNPNTWDQVPRCFTLCAWCGRQIRDGDRSSGPSHGICEPCMADYFPDEYRKIREQAGWAGD